MIGETVSHYRILSKLGGGGMGVVYEAEDLNLNRKVALKFLPDARKTPDALERFKREARAASALNHPHICVVHDLGEHEGKPFIAMERMKGESLKETLAKGRLPIERVVKLGVQIADGLEAAHGAGIVHRDLKPANVFVTDRGDAKILDFGLAKLTGSERQLLGSPGSEVETAAQERNLTSPGMTLGTVAYMSPEQARGQDVDARSDLFSLGVMLYEMSTGRLPFPGNTAAEIFNSILSQEPAPRSGIPATLHEVILKCLEKDPSLRYQHASDVRADFKRLLRDSGRVPGASAEAPRNLWYRRRGWAVVLLAAAIAGVAALALRRSASPPRSPALRVSLTQLTTDPGVESQASLSPDGKSLVYVGQSSGRAGGRGLSGHIYLLRVGGKNAINLTKDSSDDNSEPAFSPDGERIAFRSERDGGGIFVMGATGESVKRLTDFGYNPAWSPDGAEIVCSTAMGSDPYRRPAAGQLWRIHVATGEKRKVSDGNALQPSWSPHGHRIAYYGGANVWTILAEGGPPVAVTAGEGTNWNPMWSSDGKWLYFGSSRGGSMNLWRVPVDEMSGEVLGSPEALTAGGTGLRGPMSLSADRRRIAYTERIDTSNIERIRFDPEKEIVVGVPEPVTRGTLQVSYMDLSPDGDWLAFNSLGEQEDIYVVGTDGGARRQLTDDPATDRGPRWSPDGKQIAFFSSRGGKNEVWAVGIDGTGLRQLTTTTDSLMEPAWSPDGSRLSFNGEASYIVDLSTAENAPVPELIPYAQEDGPFRAFAWSPDGRRIAGFSTGILTYSIEGQVFERLTESGFGPRWLSDGQRLVYVNGEDGLSVVDSRSKRSHTLLSLLPDTIFLPVPSPDDRWIYFVRRSAEADVWLLTLE